MSEVTEQLKSVYDNIAETFSKSRHKLWPEMVALSELVKAGNVIDIGCGNGRLFEIFAENPDIRYEGTDFAPKMIEIANRRYGKFPRKGMAPEFFVSDMTDMKLKESYYNGIFLIASYHHIPEKEKRLKLLKELKKSLKKDGVVVITVWNLWSSKTIRRVFESWFRKAIRKERGGIFDIYYPFNDHGKVSYRFYKMFTHRNIMRELETEFNIVKEERWKEGQNLVFYLKAK